ncbi:hypothetical protein L0152_08325, partial [bacterium]|nr:hypothetical protein [bacterium]
VMAFDEKGQADTRERKVEICSRAYDILTKDSEFPPEDIIFIDGGATSGMGNFKIHGNVHILGPPKPPISTDINVTVKGNQGWYNDYTSGTPITATLAAVLDPAQAARTSLDAKIRDRNGLIDAQNGSAEFGTSATPFDAVFGCDDCGGVFGFTNFASTLVRAAEMGPYDVPDSVLAKIKVPLLTEQYKDERGVLYPNYEGYLIGIADAGGISGNHLPGVLGLRMATMNMGNSESDWTITFGNPTTIAQGSLAKRLLPNTPAATNERNELFLANVNTSSNTNPVQQPIIDSSAGLDANLNPVIPPNSGKTFMLVAVDEANDVAIIYKEVQPFDRNVDKDLGGPGGFSNLHTNRQVHGLIMVPQHIGGLGSLNFRVDIDGDNVDGGPDFNSSFAQNYTGADAMNLLRKAVNALWLASQGTCIPDSSNPCWTSAPHDSWVTGIPENLRNGINFTSVDAPKLVGSGVIQLTDQFQFDSGCSTCEGLRYAGRFSFFSEETGGASNATSSGYANIIAGPRPVPTYKDPPGTGEQFSFPCDNSMGIMAARRIDMGDPFGTHDEFAGAFYAYELLKVQKQIQILGAIVAQDFDLLGGGNPDWFQAMEMPGCLPPEMIGKEPVVYIRSQSYSDR